MSNQDIEQATSTKTSSATNPESEPVYHQYKYRFVILLLYTGVSIGNQMLWVTCSPITTNLENVILSLK